MTTPKVLPADVYDALELAALAYGGIGADLLYEEWDSPEELRAPLCVLGMARFAANEDAYGNNPITNALLPLFADQRGWGPLNAVAEANNLAVRAIAKDEFGPKVRVSWKEYTRELNIVRGD